MKKVMVLLISLNMLGGMPLGAQQVVVKKNLLSDATATFSLGVEKMFGRHSSLSVSTYDNPWTFSDFKRWNLFLGQPEWRYWFSERWHVHVMGWHIHGGVFNIGNVYFPTFTDFRKLDDVRYEGWMVGVGMAYGYSRMLTNHLNLETTIGIGYSYSDYENYDCPKCSEWLCTDSLRYLSLLQ